MPVCPVRYDTVRLAVGADVGVRPKKIMSAKTTQVGIARGLDRLAASRGRQFWLLQTMGWGAYFAAAYIGALAYEKPSSYVTLIVGAAVSAANACP